MEHVRADRSAQKVPLLLVIGIDVKDLAAALGITQPKRRKHYFSEIRQREAMRLKVKAGQ